jgi:hypothetical protein
MSTRRFEDLLDECLDMLRAGASVDDCVAPYPEHADELRQQLAVAQSLISAGPTVLPRPGAQSQRRAVLLSAVAAQALEPEARPSALQAVSMGLRRFAMVPQALPVLLLLLVLGGTAVGVSAAAGGSAPLNRLLGDSSSQHRYDLRGTVASVGAASFTVTTNTGQQTISITPQTRFEGIASLGELQAGDTVKVSVTEQDDGSLVAREIEREQVASSPVPTAVDDGAQDDDSSGPGNGNNDDPADDDDHSGPGDGEDDDDSGPGTGQDANGPDDDDHPGQGQGGDDDGGEDPDDDNQGSDGDQGNGNGQGDDDEDDDHPGQGQGQSEDHSDDDEDDDPDTGGPGGGDDGEDDE